MVHLRVVAVGAVAVAPSVPAVGMTSGVVPRAPAPASVDVTVVEETCLEPEERRLLELPAEEFGECCEPREAERGATVLGGLPPAERGLPGGRVSVTDIRPAIGLWIEPDVVCCPTVVPLAGLLSGGDPVLLLNGELEFVPFALATDTGAAYPLGLKAAVESNEDVLIVCFSCLKVLSAVTVKDCARDTAGSDSPRVNGGLTEALCSSTDSILLDPLTSPFA